MFTVLIFAINRSSSRPKTLGTLRKELESCHLTFETVKNDVRGLRTLNKVC